MYAKCARTVSFELRDVVRLRTPAVLKINLRNAYPRCYVTRKIRGDEGFYFGPFPVAPIRRGIQHGIAGPFQARRCQIKILRDPTFPGVHFSEMKMCLAPCFAGCTEEEYRAEVGQLLVTLDSSGEEFDGVAGDRTRTGQ